MIMTGDDFNLLTVVLLIAVVLLGAICFWQRSEMRRKNRTLARLLKENIGYKFT